MKSLLKLPGQASSNRKLVTLVKLPTLKNAINDDASDTQINPSEKPAGTPRKLPALSTKNPGSPCGIDIPGFEALLTEVLANLSGSPNEGR